MDIFTNPVYFFLALGIALIVIELAIMQLSVFWLLFFGLGSLVTSLLIVLIPELSWMGGGLVFVISSLFIAAAIHKPLKKWQQNPGPMSGNDAIGQKVDVLTAVTADKPGKVQWSGSEWHAELSSDSESGLNTGDQATIVDMIGITLIVK